MNHFRRAVYNLSVVKKGRSWYHYHKKAPLFREVFRGLNLPKKPVRKVYVDVFPKNKGMGDWNAIAAILRSLRLEATYNPEDEFLFAIKWHDSTFKKDNKMLRHLAKSKMVLNLGSQDISKEYLDQLHGEIFGCRTKVDPLLYQGACVKKSNLNSLHDGTVVTCPIEERDVDSQAIYQILIDTCIATKGGGGGELLEEVRVPFFKDHIPLVYLKYKYKKELFASKIQKAIVKRPEELFSSEEIEKIILLAQRMNLDFAEMDVLRHRDSGQIYVIDVNDTPGGFPKTMRGDILSDKEKKEVLIKLCRSFYESFLQAIY